MNWILLAVLAVLIIGAVIGYRKGILKIAVSLVSMIVSLVACMFVTPALCSLIKTNTQIHTQMTQSVYNMIIKSDMYNNAYNEAVSDAVSGLSDSSAIDVVGKLSSGKLGDYEEQIAEYVSAVADKMNLPETVMQDYSSSLLTGSVGTVLENEVVTLKSLLAAVFAARLADMAINSIVYIGVFAVMYVILKIVLMATGIIAKLPLIRQANRLVGMAFGFVEALVVVWLLFAVVTACSNFEWAQTALAMIGNNEILSYIYEKNMITKTILG